MAVLLVCLELPGVTSLLCIKLGDIFPWVTERVLTLLFFNFGFLYSSIQYSVKSMSEIFISHIMLSFLFKLKDLLPEHLVNAPLRW